ncbi:hypothetical protein AOLI_G00194620 [Acnodon oligacanthus]
MYTDLATIYTSDDIHHAIEAIGSGKGAQSYYRKDFTDLASISSSRDNKGAQAFLPAAITAWISLSRTGWTWSDKSQSTFRNWLNGELMKLKKNCALIDTDLQSRWLEESCSETLPFLCYTDDEQTAGSLTGKRQILSVEVWSDHNVDDPEVKESILEMILQELKQHGMAENTMLTWRKMEEKE